jgi:uncharacterized protein YggE
MERNYIAALLVGLTVLAVALVGAMAVSGAVGADSVQESNANQQISVDAVGEAEAEPDKAIVNVVVRAEGEDPGSIRDALAEGAADLESALNEEGVEYKTTNYEIREPYRNEPDAPELVGLHGFQITVDNPDNVGNIIDVATNAGAEVSNIRMTLSEEKSKELRDQAIENAMNDAREQADTIASAGDLVVTGVINVDAHQRHYSPVSFDSAPAAQDGASGAPTNIETGQVSVTYNVEVTFDADS